MSDERKPLLSDEYMHEMIVHGATNDKPETPYRVIAESVRSFYELLIAEGKLRVVEEVEEVEVGGNRECSKCGSYTDDGDPIDAPVLYTYCPGCGNKIKRCTSA